MSELHITKLLQIICNVHT